ncbi:peptidoglycan-binding domain-containing protein [Oceaniradius stylonematis]|uniref:peptidoglycan-binding domain-containing protein n=1 Tax=Oceaniradius stylonematis TaxID=2184161 RepID=UPI003C7CF84E
MHEFSLEFEIRVDDPLGLRVERRQLAAVGYSKALDDLFLQPRLATLNWGERPRFRRLNDDDRHVIEQTIGAIPEIISRYISARLGAEVDFVVYDIKVESIILHCIKFKVFAKLKTLAEIAAVLGVLMQGYTFIDQSPAEPVSVSCQVYVTEPRYVANHIEHILEHAPAELLDHSDSQCTRLKQILLEQLGYYTGSIDGKYGNLTAAAEAAFAADEGLTSRDTEALYKRVVRRVHRQLLAEHMNDQHS